MANITHKGTQFTIDDAILAKYKELIELILNTESMDNNERQYWFDMLPSMTDAQVDRLYNILDTERKKLQALEIKYQDEIKKLNEKHLVEWQQFQDKQAAAKKAQQQAEEADQAQNPDDILNQLRNL